MLTKLNRIRYTYIRSHFYAFSLDFFLLLALLLAVHVWFGPKWLTVEAVVFFIICFVIIGAFTSLLTGFQFSTALKHRMDRLSTMIRQLSRGEYTFRIPIEDQEEMTGLSEELNELGGKLEYQKESLVKLADEKAELARSAHKAATIEERQRLARDLHDAVSQQLFALTMMAQATERILEKKPDKAKKQLHEITQMALQAQTEMRALLLHLRPVHLSGDSLTSGIESLVEELKQKCSLKFHLDMEDSPNLSKTAEEHVFRVLQEALSNILRHANASNVTINISSSGREVFVHIADDGNGFSLADHKDNKASYGLKTMRERCEEIGGEFSIRSREGEGTYIDIRIPMMEKEEIG
ncbi:HAMP domain-containing sensor histidine kinase [Halobacillus salinus]|uniref:HAMP domain-containing sensor histidine kinase n=1 Tax=Halobacillus salinus TaxID=192814 RepID=UPI0009A729B5|nr:sensor histidine kinase [Halobacillus salinus]